MGWSDGPQFSGWHVLILMSVSPLLPRVAMVARHSLPRRLPECVCGGFCPLVCHLVSASNHHFVSGPCSIQWQPTKVGTWCQVTCAQSLHPKGLQWSLVAIDRGHKPYVAWHRTCSSAVSAPHFNLTKLQSIPRISFTSLAFQDVGRLYHEFLAKKTNI